MRDWREICIYRGKGSSVIDYAITDYAIKDGETLKEIERLEVKARVESDHLPLMVSKKERCEGEKGEE